MQKLLVLAVLMLLLCGGFPVLAKVSVMPGEDVQSEARRGFEEILDLWRDGRQEELYRRTIASGKHSLQSFVGKLASCDHRPACCWEKMQDVTITVKDAGKVIVHAKIGMEGHNGSTIYVTKKFKLEKEDGCWRISQADILALAGSGKKKARR